MSPITYEAHRALATVYQPLGFVDPRQLTGGQLATGAAVVLGALLVLRVLRPNKRAAAAKTKAAYISRMAEIQGRIPRV